MRHVVYPLTVQLDYTELRFSLRSLEKHLQHPFEVVIVGDMMPDWINNVTQIELPDIKSQVNNYSVRRKILAALEYVEEILLMNDDFFLLKETDFPYYSSGILKTKGEAGAKQLLKQLESYNKLGKYYGHYPAVVKQDFKETIHKFSNEVPTKSAYLNFIEANSIEIQDCKIMTAKKPVEIREFIKNKPCFSTGVYSIKSCIPVLDELFPEPSIYEI